MLESVSSFGGGLIYCFVNAFDLCTRRQRPGAALRTVAFAFSTRIKDAGIAIRLLQAYTFSVLQGPEMDFREWNWCVPTQKNKTISKIHFLL